MTPPESPRPKKPGKRVTAKRTVRKPAKRADQRAGATEAHRGTRTRATVRRSGDRAPQAARKTPAKRATRSARPAREQTTPVPSRATSASVRDQPEAPARARGSSRRRLVRVTALLAIPALIASAFLVLHTSLFDVASVTVVGAHETPAAEIIATAGLDSRPPLIDVNPAAVSARIESLPWIKTATVIRHWPKSVAISVTERVPVAEASIRRHRWELFDAEGRALGFRTLRTTGLVRLRQISPMPSPGSVATATLGSEVALADALPIALVSQVREVSYSPSDELSITLSSGPVVVFGNATALSDKVVALTTLLADHVSLAGVTVVNLSVPSSPVLSSAPPVAKAQVKPAKVAPSGTTPTTAVG